MIGDEFNEIITSGEFSTKADDISLIAIYKDIDYPISGLIYEGWKRKETDGVLATELPRKATTFKISKSSLPSIILDDNKFSNIIFEYDNILWKVVYVIGKDLLAFMVVPQDDLTTDNEVGEQLINDVSNDDAPGLV